MISNVTCAVNKLPMNETPRRTSCQAARRAPRQIRALRFVLLLPTASLLLVLAGCKKKVEEAPKPEVSVQAVHPQMGSITEEIVGDATLAPVAQAAIQPKITAPVKHFFVRRGSRVAAGQLVAVLENSDLAAAALDNKGTYTAAQGTYETATQLGVPQEVTQARLDVAQTKAALDLAQNILNARSKLFAQGASPGRDVDTARAAVQQAQAAYQIAQQKNDALERVGRKASLETAQGQLASAKGKYLGAEAMLNYTSIRTPIRGVVTDRPLFAGETAAAGTAIVTVMDTSSMIAKIHLAQVQAQQLALGADAELQVPGVEAPVAAKVSLVSPALDAGSTTVEVWLKAKNADGRLKAGTAVHATIKGRTVPHTLLIPAEAVQRSSDAGGAGGKTVIVMAADGTAHKRNVSLGIETAEMVQVMEGLALTDTVLTTGGYGLDDGTKVKVEAAKVEAAKPAAAGEKD